MSAEANKAIIPRLIEEVYNEDNQDVLHKLVAPDVFNHSAVPEHHRSIEEFRYVNRWVLAVVRPRRASRYRAHHRRKGHGGVISDV